MAFITKLGQLRAPVASYSALPITNNVLGDVRISTDTGDAYTWMLEASSGSLTNWMKVTSSSYADLIGAPFSTALDIDNAVKVVKSLSINISLLAFNTLTGFGAAIAKMFDGLIHQFNSDNSGLDLDESSNYTQIDNTYYMPNKGDLDIYTKILIHGDGIQGSGDFVDLIRHTLYNHNAITDTAIKKFGTGSIKFNGTTASVDLGRLVENDGALMNYTEAVLDFWFYSLASGLQPIISNDAYTGVTSYSVGEVIDIKRLANGHISASLLVTTDFGSTQTTISVEGTTVISDNAWNHITIQRTATGYLQIWVNGVLDATSSTAMVPDEGAYYPVLLVLGKRDIVYLNGYLDEIRISNITRYTTTFTPMTKAYNTATTPAPTPTIEDESDSAHTVVVNGGARMSGSNPLFGNASLYLDGINSYLTLADSDDWQLCSESGAVDSYTKLLLHLDNNLTDSAKSKVVTNNNVTFSVSSKFGSHAASFNGTNSSLVIGNSSDWFFDTGDFTIDCWANFPAGSGVNALYAQGNDGNNRVSWSWNSSNIMYFFIVSNGTSVVRAELGFTPTFDTWYHLALVRYNGVLKIYINGVAQLLGFVSGTGAESIPNYSGTFEIGHVLSGSDNFYLKGLIDEYRVSKGIARWTSNFTPSSVAYGTSLSDYTVDLWIDPLQITDLNTFIIGQDDSWKLTLDGTSSKYLKFSIVGGASIVAPIALSLNTWQHVAIVQSSGTIKLYVNGVLGASITGTPIGNGVSTLSIGATSTGANMFNGFIEEVHVSKGIARWTAAFTPPSVEYTSDSNTKLLLPLNVQTVPNMVLQSVGYVSNYVPTSARVVIFEEDIDVMEPNVDLKIEVSRDGGTTFSTCLIAKDQNFGDGTLNLFSGSVDLSSQPNGELMVWKLTTENNKDCRIRGISMNWR